MKTSFPRTNRVAKDLDGVRLENVFPDSEKQSLLEFTRELRDSLAAQLRAMIYAFMRGRYYIGRRKPRKAYRHTIRKMRRKWYKGK